MEARRDGVVSAGRVRHPGGVVDNDNADMVAADTSSSRVDVAVLVKGRYVDSHSNCGRDVGKLSRWCLAGSLAGS